MDPPKRALLLPPPPVVKKEAKTYCFELTLGESNDQTYPEFSWKDLVRDAQKKEAASKTETGGSVLNPYASDDEDDLKAMAARFEQKYNKSNSGTLGKRKRRAEDYIDRGAGYDLEDPFIDNNDIYDEVVPEDMEPVHGGFYINSGSLDYKEVEVSDCDVDEELEDNKKCKKQPDVPMSSKSNLQKCKKQPTGIVKRRGSGNGVPPKKKMDKNEGKSVKCVSSSNANARAEVQKDGSRSTSPAKPKKNPSTVILSSSDSSSSSSEDSSTADSSDSDTDSESKTQIHPVITKGKLQVQTSTSNSLTPSPKGRLKLKNVPLNPKLHGSTDDLRVKPKNSASPMSNRDIFGSSQSMTNISSLNIPSGLSATSMTVSTAKLSKPSPSNAHLTTVTTVPVKRANISKPRKSTLGRPRVVDTALKSATAPRAGIMTELPIKKQRKPRVSSASVVRQQGIKFNAKHGSVMSPAEGLQQFQAQLESSGVMPTLTPYRSTAMSMSIPSDPTKVKNNSRNSMPVITPSSAHQNFGQLGSGITVTEVQGKISRPPALTPSPQLLFNNSITSTNSRAPPNFGQPSNSAGAGISLPASITITTPTPGLKVGETRTNVSSRITPSTLPSTHGKLLKPQHITPFDVSALLAHASGSLNSMSSEKNPMMSQLPYQQREVNRKQ